MAYLTCSGLTVGYEGKPIAESISFSVAAGDALFVVGKNGSGKTTLVRTMLGLLPAVAGRIDFGDGAGPGEVGYLPQRNESQRDFPASAWEVALSGRTVRLGKRPFFSREDKRAAKEALERVDAYSLRHKPFGVLSGGQQQRVLLARALAAFPKMLILDEPTTGLDPNAAESLYQQVDRLRADGVGVIAVTHDVVGAMPHATHVLAIDDGRSRFTPIGEWRQEGGASWED